MSGTCTNCGTQNAEDAAFCSRCGARIKLGWPARPWCASRRSGPCSTRWLLQTQRRQSRHRYVPCFQQAGHTGIQWPRRCQTWRYSLLAELVEVVSEVVATRGIGAALVDIAHRSALIPMNVPPPKALPRQPRHTVRHATTQIRLSLDDEPPGELRARVSAALQRDSQVWVRLHASGPWASGRTARPATPLAVRNPDYEVGLQPRSSSG